MGKTVNILFLGGAKRYSLAERFITAGKELDCHVNIFSYELDSDVPIAGIGKVIIGKRWNDPELFTDLKKTIQKNSINIILPFVDPSISVLSEYKKIDSSVFVPVSDKTICDTMFDKVLANQWFIKNGIPVPDQETGFPLIAKPRKGSASQGLIKINNKIEFDEFQQKHNINDYLVQKFFDAFEFTVDAYVSMNHKIIGVIPRRRIEVVMGEVIKAITEFDQNIIDISNKILDSGNFIGPITIQFLKDKSTGAVYTMEINPRFGGGVLNSIEAGFNVPLILLKEYLKMPVDPIINWRRNLLMLRTNREIFICK